MLEDQKKLLADINAAERSALRILSRGVKIAGVVQKLRGARDEIQARVRHLEQSAQRPARTAQPATAAN